MPLTNPRISVLQEWVMELSLREQGTLLVAMRGCDLSPKYPLDSDERRLTAAIRGHTMVPADPREVDRTPGAFMSLKVPSDVKISKLSHYPSHWLMHIVHAVEVLAYRYPDIPTRILWWHLYYYMVTELHLAGESETEFTDRMLEDRIANNTVVT
jgi:hypothetical protein